jgi:NAD(P)-dependent dehydrogenase (short-subunit alcohol dehydrogenase family)
MELLAAYRNYWRYTRLCAKLSGMDNPYPKQIPDEFVDRKALVTGGSRGIGAAVAEYLLNGGASVVTSARTKTEDTPAASIFITADIRSVSGAQKLVDEAVGALGGLDILINNAGAARVYPGGAATIPDDEWLDSLDINFLSAVRVTNAALPALKESSNASIINISSTSALDAGPVALHYAAAKAALNTYNKGLAQELAPLSIRVNAVTPGAVVTPGGTEVLQAIVDAMGAPLEAVLSTIPLGRRGHSRDIAEMVGFLVSDRAQWITGENFMVDGGA